MRIARPKSGGRRGDCVNALWGAPPPHRPPSAEERAALAEIYRDVDAALAPLGDACRACGKCCRFERGGIVLFASALELAYLVAEAGRSPAAARVAGGAPEAAWRCPYQEKDPCTARSARLLGCRTYFCDAPAQARGEEVYREAHERIRQVSDRPSAAAGASGRWWYGPARAYLATLARDRHLAIFIVDRPGCGT